MRIAVDAFGGDNAPDEAIKGAVWAAVEYGVDIILTGDKDKLEERLSALSLAGGNIKIVDADGVIQIEDNPLDIRKEKAGTSMGKAFQLLASGQADAFVSAGSTAALVVGGTMIAGRIKGVKRPALAPIMPSTKGFYMLLDGGANLDCRPEMLLQFAVLGSVYMQKIMNINNPRVGLLNIGTEDKKGRELELLALDLMRSAPINFIGNVEGRDPILGGCDVAVTDGFTGNVYLKAVEGMGGFIKHGMEGIFNTDLTTKLGYLFSKKGIKNFAKTMDYKEVGGSPLLGCKSAVIKAHGSSDSRAFKNAIRQARDFIERGVVFEMEKSLQEVKN
ncbi:MAG: phosphate acyltransferase PlsX [Eubacterium sp.]|jgi:glycerol-3-phosphate acyltransferase PlsX|nr:phosphate acyltransferase PlsX [Eubacterium sp.]